MEAVAQAHCTMCMQGMCVHLDLLMLWCGQASTLGVSHASASAIVVIGSSLLHVLTGRHMKSSRSIADHGCRQDVHTCAANTYRMLSCLLDVIVRIDIL
jgi:hypothetical protein